MSKLRTFFRACEPRSIVTYIKGGSQSPIEESLSTISRTDLSPGNCCFNLIDQHQLNYFICQSRMCTDLNARCDQHRAKIQSVLHAFYKSTSKRLIFTSSFFVFLRLPVYGNYTIDR